MKISTLQENLKQGLSLVGHVAGKNINLPILNNVLVEAKDGLIKLTSTNLEIGISCLIRGKVEEEGAFTVNAKIVSDYVALLQNKKIDLENKEKKLLVQSDNYKTTIKSEDVDDYPPIPQIGKELFYKCSAKEFKKALSQTIFAVSGNESRIELTGVLFVFNKDRLCLAATDSYRLAEKELVVESNSESENKVIIPVKTLQEVARIIGTLKDEQIEETDSKIIFYISDNQIMFSIGTTEIISRTIEGQYPDYKQIIPNDFKTDLIIRRDEIIRAIKAASIFSRTGVNDVSIDFKSEEKKTVISSSSQQSGENITELDSVINGVDNGITLNFKYLIDGLNNIESENVIIKIVDNNTPCILLPEGEDKYLYIVMPIKQ